MDDTAEDNGGLAKRAQFTSNGAELGLVVGRWPRKKVKVDLNSNAFVLMIGWKRNILQVKNLVE